jgi:hypothetical protein
MLSDSAVVRPAAPRLENTASYNDEKHGASDDKEQDIQQISAARRHRHTPAASVELMT